MSYSALKKQIEKDLPDIHVHLDHSLAPYTTLKIGGPADIFIHTTNPNQFISLLKLLHQQNFAKGTPLEPQASIGAITILGHGSNVLISDTGIRGIVIKNSGNYITNIPSSTNVRLSSGTSLPYAIQYLHRQDLVGLEDFAYIPATIGGAILSNIHGTNQKTFSDFVKTVTVFNLKTGQSNTLKSTNLPWSYDSSSFQQKTHLIITETVLKLKRGDGKKAQKITTTIIKEKNKTQPLNSAGCTFKNPPSLPTAGSLIDQLGLKGQTINDAQVSPLHANFIINTGKSTAKDYLKLARLVQQKVKASTGVNLEFEIKLLGKF